MDTMSVPKKQMWLYFGFGSMAALFFIASVAAWVFSEEPELHHNALSKEQLASLDDFDKGQYYFNHDGDPAPSYDLSKARKFYVKVVEEDPSTNPMAWYQIGRIDFLRGNFSSAIEKFEKQIEYFGDDVPNVYYMLGLTNGYKARQTGDAEDWRAAAEGFSTFLEYEPESPWGRTDLAWVYFAQGEYESMLPVLEEGLQYAPDNPWLLNMYGLALLNTGQKGAAVENFTKAKEYATTLTPKAWGSAYPGNNPSDWAQGLREFRTAIDNNLALAKS